MATAPLSELVQQLPPVSLEEVEQFFRSFPTERLASEGRRVASDRVITDTSRLYGLAAEFWEMATQRQHQALTGFSPELLALAVHEAHRLEKANEQFQRRADDDQTVREVTARDLGDSWGDALRKKSHAAKALRPIAGGDGTRLTELQRASSGTEDPDDLARRLDDLAALAKRWMADPALALPVKLARLTDRYADELLQTATQLRQAANAARARKTIRITQGDLDVLDGRNMYLLRQIVDLFDEAHLLDASIPRLIPLALANAFGRRRSARGSTGETSSPEPEVEPEIEPEAEATSEPQPPLG